MLITATLVAAVVVVVAVVVASVVVAAVVAVAVANKKKPLLFRLSLSKTAAIAAIVGCCRIVFCKHR